MFLSKSKYIKGIQYAKSLWLNTYKNEVLSTPNRMLWLNLARVIK